MLNLKLVFACSMLVLPVPAVKHVYAERKECWHWASMLGVWPTSASTPLAGGRYSQGGGGREWAEWVGRSDLRRGWGWQHPLLLNLNLPPKLGSPAWVS